MVAPMSIDHARARSFIDQVWGDTIVPALVDYIAIPNKSPAFDAEWAAHGYMDDAVELAGAWATDHLPKGATYEVVRLPGRTPLIFIDIPGTAAGTVVLYGHLDKQPEMSGWDADLGPWKPVLRDEKLYGRGGADDGYAIFASLTAINALQALGVPHARCVVIIECCEESGSYDLPPYIDRLADRIGHPDLVVCLDSGCGNYDQLWCTTSLRGMVGGELRVDVLREGVHSGNASGIAASSFPVLRKLLDRIEDVDTGRIELAALDAEIPADRAAQAAAAAEVLGDAVSGEFPWHGAMRAMVQDRAELVLNRTWRPTLSVTGAAGLPALGDAGNVLRPYTTAKLSFRLAPTTNSAAAADAIANELTRDPPYGATVRFDGCEHADGWNAPTFAGWVEGALDEASRAWFGPGAMYMGEGGTIPFMGMLGEKFPRAQFVITGVLGPKSNAHGPNEFLHLPCARRLTGCVASVLADHASR